MNKIFLLLLMFSVSLLPVYAMTTDNGQVMSPMEAKKMLSMDSEIVALLITLNTNEINLSQMAVKKSSDTAVVNFANQMITDHGKNRDETMKISQNMNIPAKITAKVIHLKNDGISQMKKLSYLKGADFNRMYVNDMVMNHNNALKLVNKLLMKVNNPTLKNQLEMTKNAIMHHLEEATTLNASLRS